MQPSRRILSSAETSSGTVILIVLAGVIAAIVCCTLVCVICYSRSWSSDRASESPDKQDFNLKPASSSKAFSHSSQSPTDSVRVPPPPPAELVEDIMSPAWPGMASEEDPYIPPSHDYGLMSRPRNPGSGGVGTHRSQPFAPRVRQPLWPTHLSTIHSVGTVTATQSEADFHHTQNTKSMTLPDTPRASQHDPQGAFGA
eukprot:jgi/Ulvmu1/9086/UM005_0181.1